MAIDASAVGRVYPPQPYEVSREKVREFAEAIGDMNPVYVDVEAARQHSHDEVVAPPTFVMIPVMRGFDILMEDLGIEFARVVHVDQRFTYSRPLIVGDRLETTTTLDAIRQVAGNDLLTIRNDVRAAESEHVCTAQATLLIRPEENGDV
ncbi:MaoC family dehydratase N-terminal domain-containing protein [Phytoactinopolyspora endophytica]|uniref:MaoC family dehydratase N-terminal domain-containing protein n=1 Tax=Phytoactinopolyspora endophytica TaxID=1642495 RepID=UPI00101DE5A4|nr:MaoC family dehydratase N-terminal domain-containing protein [Phytoactinopolyspora endophytica]